MKIGYFTERPYQDPDLMEGRIDMVDLMMSNGRYDPMLGADLYNRYLDEKIYAEEMGFDMLMLNEHSLRGARTPGCQPASADPEVARRHIANDHRELTVLADAHQLGDPGRLIVEATKLYMSDLSLGEEQHAAERTDDIHRYGHGRWSEQHAGPPHER